MAFFETRSSGSLPNPGETLGLVVMQQFRRRWEGRHTTKVPRRSRWIGSGQHAVVAVASGVDWWPRGGVTRKGGLVGHCMGMGGGGALVGVVDVGACDQARVPWWWRRWGAGGGWWCGTGG